MKPSHNYFELLGLEQKYSQDEEALNQVLIHIQARFHPDNHANLSAQEKRLMMQYSALVNEAYSVIRSPIKRAMHLLALKNIIIDEKTSLTEDKAFLAEQMELFEAIEEATGNRQALEALLDTIKQTYQQNLGALSEYLDGQAPDDLIQARAILLKSQFYLKQLERLKQAKTDTK